MLSRADVAKDYTLDVDGIIRDPGKFEGEPWWTVALWDCVLNGFSDDETGTSDDESLTSWFRIDDELRAACGFEASDGWVTVWERSDGFVCHALPDYGPEKWSEFVTTSDDDESDGDELPPCAASMGCLCAGHARGNAASEPCDTSEGGE